MCNWRDLQKLSSFTRMTQQSFGTEKDATSKDTMIQKAHALTGSGEVVETVFPHSPTFADSSIRNGVGRPLGFDYSIQLLKIGFSLWVGDMIAMTIAMGLGLMCALLLGLQINHALLFLVFGLLGYSASFWAGGLYAGLGLNPPRELRSFFRIALGLSIATTFGLAAMTNLGSPYVLAIIVSLPIQLFLVPTIRGATRAWMRRRGIGIPVFFLGEREDVQQVYCNMNRFGSTMFQPAGRFSVVGKESHFHAAGFDSTDTESLIPYLGTTDDLISKSVSRGVFWLFLVGDDPQTVLDRNPSLFDAFPEVVVTRASRSQLCSGTSVIQNGLTSGIRMEETLLLPGPRFAKRAIDVTVSGMALLLLSPLLLLIALLIKSSSPGPVFYSHNRIGRGGQRFGAWKFRSMVPDADSVLEKYLSEHPELQSEWERDHKLKNDPRITWIGKIIRKTSIDELPQLWNVFRGNMSLVGPRPIVTEEIKKYGATFREYLRVTPGITGLWQISGRNNTTYEERLAYDEFYVRQWSPWMDMYILFRTVRTVLFCEGAY